MLALHFHQQAADAAQQADTNRVVIDEGARSSVLGDDPPQHDLVLGRQSMFVQHRGDGVGGRRVFRTTYDPPPED